jgi:uncharacterized membrane protein YkoI
MKLRLIELAAAAMLAGGVASPMMARADDDGDHDRARELYEHGDIRALHDILRIVAASVPGDIVSVNLVPDGDRWIYRFQIVEATGRRTTLDVDARAAEVLRNRGDGHQ